MATSNAVCPSAPWRSLAFLPSPSSNGTFTVDTLKQGQLNTYVREKVVPAAIANIVFALIALALLFIFCSWRSIRWCCVICCKKDQCMAKRTQANPAAVLRTRSMWIVKGIMAALAGAAIAVCVWGGVGTQREVVQGVWRPVNNTVLYLNNVTATANNISNAVPTIFPTLSTISSGLRQPVPSSINTSITSVQVSVASASTQLNSTATSRMANTRDKQQGNSESIDTIRYAASLALFLCTICIVLAFFCFVAVNCSVGTNLMLFLILILAVLFFILSVIFTTALTLNQDTCANMETFLLSTLSAGSNARLILQYVFYGSGSVEMTLAQAGIVDIPATRNSFNAQITSMQQFLGPYQGPDAAALDAAIASYRTRINQGLDTVLAQLDATRLRPQYLGIKSYICCTIPDDVGDLYVITTTLGWLLVALGMLTFHYIRMMDGLWTGTCGCRPLFMASAHSHVIPADAHANPYNEPPKATVISSVGYQPAPMHAPGTQHMGYTTPYGYSTMPQQQQQQPSPHQQQYGAQVDAYGRPIVQ